MTAAVLDFQLPKYFPDSLDLPLSLDHKTWHTERLCPPLLAQALGERQALFIAQLHYWLQKDNVGVYKHGFHWIYNAEWEWCEQFPWLSEHTLGRIRRALERRGYVVSNDFNRNPLDRTKHSTLDYYRIAQETGWNPLGLDLNRSYPHPPIFTKGVRQRGRHKSDSTPLVYLPIDGDDPESLKPPETVDSANVQNASCTQVTMHSALLPVSSIYKEIPNISKSNLETDLKIEGPEGSQGVRASQLLGTEKDTSIANEQKEVNSRVIEFSGEGQISAAAELSLINDEQMKATQQFLASLNASVERANSERTRVFDLTRPIRIPGLDEESHEILWKHQASVLELNADLYAERIQKAIADNPQHLESAILAFIENSASGAKTPEAATGFLLNALRQGWKPRQSLSRAQVSVPVYTPHPLMLEAPRPSTLEELVERKRSLWRHAPVLRDSIEAWVEQTRGVVMTHDGPARADAANAGARPDLEPNSAEHLETPDEADFTPPEDNAESQKLDSEPPLEVEQLVDLRSEPPHLEVNQASLVASNQIPAAAATPTESVPHQPPATDSAGVESPKELPLAKRKQQPNNRQLQPVEILTSAGEWESGYFVHHGMAVANLVGSEQRFQLFDANGESYIFFGQIRPPSVGLNALSAAVSATVASE